MKKIHRKIEQQRAKFVKRLAGEIQPIRCFPKHQTKLLHEFYIREAMPAMQAKQEVLRMSVPVLNKLYFQLMDISFIKENANGSCFDEKLTMICFCVRHKRMVSEEITRHSLSARLEVFYQAKNF